jgi:ABC-type transport system substrate-binding protein
MRRLIVGILALALGIFGLAAGSLGQKASAPRGEVRIVDKFSNAWGFIVLYTMEHLMEIDRQGNLVPRLATGWRWVDDRTLEVKLRRGVRFQNGEAFDAEIVKLNWEENTRQRQPHMVGIHMSFRPGSRVEIRDPYTVRFISPATDGGMQNKLTNMHLASRQFYRELGWGKSQW